MQAMSPEIVAWCSQERISPHYKGQLLPLDAVCQRVRSNLELPEPLCWKQIERELREAHNTFGKPQIRKALAIACGFLRANGYADAPQLVASKRSTGDSPAVHAGDCEKAAWFEALGRAHHQRLQQWLAGDKKVGLAALTLTAVLRVDLPSPSALDTWWGSCFERLDPWGDGIGGDVPVVFPDALTRLAMRYFQQAHPDIRHMAEEAELRSVIDELLTELPSPPSCMDDSGLDGVLEASASWRRFNMPLVLQAASQPGATQATTGASWRMVRGLPTEAPDEELVAEKKKLAFMRRWPDAALWQRLKTDLPSVKECQKSHIIAALRQHSTAPWTAALTILAIEWLIDRAQRTDKPLAINTLLRDINGLSHLLSIPDCADAVVHRDDGSLHVSVGAWKRVCAAVNLAAANDDKVLQVTRTLLSDLKKTRPEFSCLRGIRLKFAKSTHRVRAHLISNADFEQAMGMLPLTGQQLRIAQLIAALGQYTGMRRSEILGLRVADVVDPLTLTLCVRFYRRKRGKRSHELKSEESRRDVPAGALLPGHWVQALRDQFHLTSGTGSDPRGMLFRTVEDAHDTKRDDLIAPIVDALRTATGNWRVSFHTTRHSFATFAYLRKALIKWPELRLQPAPILDHPEFSPSACREWIEAWVPGGATRLERFDVNLTNLMGHVFMSTTVKSYLHLFGLIDRAVRTARLPEPDRKVVRSLLNLDERTWTRLVGSYYRSQKVGNGSVGSFLQVLETNLLKEAGFVARTGGRRAWN